ncbi:MAG: 3'(2'),5'-bisphosphate nucleotidase CysQ [Spirochaetales bacterium]|nr:3'(2'),5'-bisphosphate nucleotidase CysQ [Spirochaetales bacterium]
MKISSLAKLASLLTQAGQAVMEIYDSQNYTWDKKGDGSPLTEADSQSHTILQEGLDSFEWDGEILPVLSEEGADIPYEVRRHWQRYWLVDPLDGTKEFISRNGDFTVNVALIEAGEAVLGLVYLPVDDVLYFGMLGWGAYRLDHASHYYGDSVFANAHRIHTCTLPVDVINLVTSRSHRSPRTKTYIESISARHSQVNVLSRGSSIKLCLVAEGSAHAYPRFTPTMEWDIAAAHAICRSAGARVSHWETGEEMLYNNEDLRNSGFIASCHPSLEQIL